MMMSSHSAASITEPAKSQPPTCLLSNPPRQQIINICMLASWLPNRFSDLGSNPA